jgi:hypothetical protein
LILFYFFLKFEILNFGHLFSKNHISVSVLTTPINFWSMTDEVSPGHKKVFYWPPNRKCYGAGSLYIRTLIIKLFSDHTIFKNLILQ